MSGGAAAGEGPADPREAHWTDAAATGRPDGLGPADPPGRALRLAQEAFLRDVYGDELPEPPRQERTSVAAPPPGNLPRNRLVRLTRIADPACQDLVGRVGMLGAPFADLEGGTEAVAGFRSPLGFVQALGFDQPYEGIEANLAAGDEFEAVEARRDV